MKWLALLVAAAVLVGCQPTTPPAEGATGAPAPDESTMAAPSGGGEGVGIVSPAAGGLSPVTGSDSVTGAGGGGVGNAAKDRAKGAAAASSGRNYSTDSSGE